MYSMHDALSFSPCGLTYIYSDTYSIWLGGKVITLFLFFKLRNRPIPYIVVSENLKIHE